MKSFIDIEEKAARSENQYILALAVAKRIRHLKAGAPALLPATASRRAIELALEEIARGQIEYRIPEKQES
jgi:DNA-directed RNA polymerase subunit K/omega